MTALVSVQNLVKNYQALRPLRIRQLTVDEAYDYVARTLRMTGNVSLQRDQTEVQGCDIIYNLTTEGFSSGDSDCENPFRLRRIVPDADQRDGASPPQ